MYPDARVLLKSNSIYRSLNEKYADFWIFFASKDKHEIIGKNG